jgi:hypothetical protein
MDGQNIVSGIMGICPECEESVSLIPNKKLGDPRFSANTQKLIKEKGLGECGQYWTVRHDYPEKGIRRAGSCFGGLCPSRLVR